MSSPTPVTTPRKKAKRWSRRILGLLGPAFVAAIAYVDPGNVAANISAGSQFGYLLLWVLVAANVVAMFVQYQSAKLGLVTGRNLPEILGRKLTKPARLAFWAQAEIVAIATDLAEVIGGALALHLLFHIPLIVGAVIIGAFSTLLLMTQNDGRQKRFEMLIIVLLLIITAGFLGGLILAPPDMADLVNGLVPKLQGPETVILAASMLGATVMPHAIYLHSSLVNDRFKHNVDRVNPRLKATRIDVIIALAFAGLVNIGLLVLAASALYGVDGTETIQGTHAAIVERLGVGVGIIFSIGLLASGLASTSVGSYAGSEVMKGLLKWQISPLARRLITLVPALIVVALGVDPTSALVWSQVLLSVGIPFAIIPLFWATRNKELMGEHADGRVTRVTADVVTFLIIALNIALLVMPFFGVDT